ncbi:hypothetical protein QE152_g23442 [Popillia japonica]|uniref:Uncharacterized protein n=1 Tax=Popillia japonica TaxID=7064 RepID=A0AAW1KIF3_POPJA
MDNTGTENEAEFTKAGEDNNVSDTDNEHFEAAKKDSNNTETEIEINTSRDSKRDMDNTGPENEAEFTKAVSINTDGISGFRCFRDREGDGCANRYTSVSCLRNISPERSPLRKNARGIVNVSY